MKRFSLWFLIFTGIGLAAFAQQKPGKAVIKTPGATCDMCKDRIEKYVSRQYGIISVSVDVKKKLTTVTWIPDRANLEEVKTDIANAGFDADDVTAEETAFNKLPRECKVVTTVPDATKDSTDKH